MLQPGGCAALQLAPCSPGFIFPYRGGDTEQRTLNHLDPHHHQALPPVGNDPRAQLATCRAPKLFCTALLLSSGSWPPPCLSVSKTKSYYAEWISLEREKKEGGWWKRNNFCEGLLVFFFVDFFFSLIPLGASL